MNKLFFENILPGTLLFSRFRLERCIAAKDSGAVYRCRDIRRNSRLVALKIVRSCLDEGAGMRGEVMLSQSVRHPHVLRAERFYTDEEFHAYTMEYHGGGTLHELLQSRAIRTLPQQLQVLAQICDGLAAIHRAHIIHRDLKPENVLVSHDMRLRIADFGIATRVEESNDTVDACITGTIDYLSPEYVLDGCSSPLSDIYAVGVIAYRLLTGRLPYDPDSVVDLLSKKAFEDPVAPVLLSSECPSALSDLILKAMERHPARRIQSASTLLEGLSEVQTAIISRNGRDSSYAQGGQGANGGFLI